jgi:hypothetical protein
MKGYQIKKDAEEFGINIDSAIRMRIRYLLQVIDQWPGYIADGGEIPPLDVWQAFDEIVDLQRYGKNSTRVQRPDAITDDMIAQAKAYPVETLVEFTRGKTKAFCHPDKNPSAFHGTRTNRIVCPVCDKKFGPIDILMERDGMTFIEAVKQLL